MIRRPTTHRLLLTSSMLLIAAGAAGGCTSTPERGPGVATEPLVEKRGDHPPDLSPSRAQAKVVLSALGRWVSAERDVLRHVAELGAQPPGADDLRELTELREAASRARAELIDALVACRALAEDDGPDDGTLVGKAREVLERHKWHIFYTGENPVEPDVARSLATLAVGRVSFREEGKSLRVGDDTFHYEVYQLEAVELGDYVHERALAAAKAPGGRPATIFRPIFIDYETLVIDREAIARVGREVFFARLDHYRALADRHQRDPRALARKAAAAGDDPRIITEVLATAQAIARWRHLGPLAAELESIGAGEAERVKRFVTAYAGFLEVQAATTAGLSELTRRKDAPLDHGAIARAALWAQMGYADAWGTVAGLLALALGAVDDPGAARADPRARAHLDVLGELVESPTTDRTKASPEGSEPSNDSQRATEIGPSLPGIIRLLELDESRLREIAYERYRAEREKIGSAR